MKKLGVNMCINWGLIWEVGVGEGLGMREIRIQLLGCQCVNLDLEGAPLIVYVTRTLSSTCAQF